MKMKQVEQESLKLEEQRYKQKVPCRVYHLTSSMLRSD